MKSIDAIDFQKNEAQNLRLQNLGADIGTPVNGLIYYSTAGTDHIRAYIDGQWEDVPRMSDVTASGISSTIVDAKGDLIVATAADTVARQAVGADGTVFVAASGQSTGVQWRTLTEADINLGATDRLVGRDTAAAGAAEEITVSGGIEFTGSGGIQTSAFTGDVTKTAGGTALTIPTDQVSNTHLANMAQSTIKGRASGAGTGDPTDLSVAQVKTILGYAATDVAFTPAQNISATTVQAAIEEAVTDLTAIVNSAVQGQKFKDPVDAHLTTALPNTPTYNSGAGTLTAGANAAFPTVDGVAAVVNQDYLITGQASTFQNGIYTLTTVGSGAAPWVLTRRSDGDAATELQDAAVMVEAGTVHVGTIWTQVNEIADLTTAAQSWIETNRNEVYTADGTTLTLTANQFSIAAGGVSNAQVNASAAIAYSKLALSNSIVNADIAAAAAIAYSKLALSNSIVNADINASAAIAYSKLNLASSLVAADVNGTGVTSGAGTVRVARSYTQAITGGATSEVITHPLNTRNVVVSLVNPSTPWDHVMVTTESTSTTTVTLRASGNLPAGYLVTIVG